MTGELFLCVFASLRETFFITPSGQGAKIRQDMIAEAADTTDVFLVCARLVQPTGCSEPRDRVSVAFVYHWRRVADPEYR
jgi:hypothetical protein